MTQRRPRSRTVEGRGKCRVNGLHSKAYPEATLVVKLEQAACRDNAMLPVLTFVLILEERRVLWSQTSRLGREPSGRRTSAELQFASATSQALFANFAFVLALRPRTCGVASLDVAHLPSCRTTACSALCRGVRVARSRLNRRRRSAQARLRSAERRLTRA
jgi:hypothetical protein